MKNIDKLSSIGLIGDGAELSADEMAAIDAMSEMELGVLIGAKLQLGAASKDSPIQTYHIAL